MDIAAQLINTDLKLFIEGVTLKKITQSFNKEKVMVDLVVFVKDGNCISHDGITGPGPDTDPTLMFCWEKRPVSEFKRKFKNAGYFEPSEFRLHNERFELIRKYSDAYTITFFDYANSRVFREWLIHVITTLEAGMMLHKLKAGRRYYTRNFAEYREFDTIEAFILHRFELWHDAVVKEYEQAVAKGMARCEGCEHDNTNQAG